RARTPITPRAGLSRWHSRNVCKAEASRFTAQARRAERARAALRGGERAVCGAPECTPEGGVADEALGKILGSGGARLGSGRQGGCRILASEARRSIRCPPADRLTLAASLCAFSDFLG
ncbi:hypothetical protein A6R68_07906, partial [Neotoma lepida]